MAAIVVRILPASISWEISVSWRPSGRTWTVFTLMPAASACWANAGAGTPADVDAALAQQCSRSQAGLAADQIEHHVKTATMRGSKAWALL